MSWPAPTTPPLPDFVAKLVTDSKGDLFWYPTLADLAHLGPCHAMVSIPAHNVPDDARIADRVRSIVSSVGNLDPEWTAAAAYEHGQERLLLYILGHSGER